MGGGMGGSLAQRSLSSSSLGGMSGIGDAMSSSTGSGMGNGMGSSMGNGLGGGPGLRRNASPSLGCGSGLSGGGSQDSSSLVACDEPSTLHHCLSRTSSAGGATTANGGNSSPSEHAAAGGNGSSNMQAGSSAQQRSSNLVGLAHEAAVAAAAASAASALSGSRSARPNSGVHVAAAAAASAASRLIHAEAEASGIAKGSNRSSSINRRAWSAEEDETIRACVDQMGPRWRLIAPLLPGRSDDSVRNRWKRLKEEADAADMRRNGCNTSNLSAMGEGDGAAAHGTDDPSAMGSEQGGVPRLGGSGAVKRPAPGDDSAQHASKRHAASSSASKAGGGKAHAGKKAGGSA